MTSSSRESVFRRARASLGEARRWMSAVQVGDWFRAGYNAAVRDMKRTGQLPTSGQAADDALERWIKTGRLDGGPE